MHAAVRSVLLCVRAAVRAHDGVCTAAGAVVCAAVYVCGVLRMYAALCASVWTCMLLCTCVAVHICAAIFEHEYITCMHITLASAILTSLHTALHVHVQHRV